MEQAGESETNTDGKPIVEQDPYFYTKRDFTSEVFKIEIGNLPKYIGFGQLRKFLNVKLNLETRKIKAIGSPPQHAFVTFRNEEDRSKALNILNGYLWKGKNLTAKPANPAADPYVVKRKAGDSEESVSAKKKKEDMPVGEILKDAVTPFWNIPYDEQLKRKEQFLQSFLQRLKKEVFKVNSSLIKFLNSGSEQKREFCKMDSIKPSPVTSAYRNKCEFSIGHDLYTKERTVGFRLSSYKEGSMSVAAPDDCVNISEAMLKVVKVFQSYVRESDKEVYNAETHKGYWRQLTVRTSRNNDILLIVVMHPQSLSKDELEEEKNKLKDYFHTGAGSSCGVTSVFFQTFDKKHAGDENASNIVHLLGKPHIEEILLGMKFQISPEAFFQINVMATEVLYEVIAEKIGLTESTTVLDICCGTGTIGLFLAKRGANVIGIEMCPEAVENANINAEINDIKTARFHCGRAEDVISSVLRQVEQSEVVAVADPPRAGLHPKVLKAIRASENIKKLIYVSCNPKTAFTNFVDLCRPTSKNYRGPPFYPVEAAPVDLFPQTPHYELVIVFDRQIDGIK